MCTCSKGEKSSKVEWQNILSVNTIFTYSLFFLTFLNSFQQLTFSVKYIPTKTTNLRPLSQKKELLFSNFSNPVKNVIEGLDLKGLKIGKIGCIKPNIIFNLVT